VKSRLLSGVAVTALVLAAGHAHPALGQTLPNWTGFYVGGFVGGATGRSSATTTTGCPPASPPGYFCVTGFGAANAAAVQAAGTGTATGSGFTGGIQIGYSWQQDRLIYGVEGDFGLLQLNGARQATGAYPVGFTMAAGDPFTVRTAFQTEWLATFRGRLGWAVTPTLQAYATGGLALTELTASASFGDFNTFIGPGTANGNNTVSKTLVGWTLGGGLEWMLNPRWSLKGEYLYVDFGKVSASGIITFPAGGPGYAQALDTRTDLSAHIGRLGINYRF
jgi:outer membrane immunogenic protein